MAALVPDQRQILLAVVDDTKRLLYAKLVASENTETVMTALATVFRIHGLPVALYTDRASWAFLTRQAGEAVDKTRLTQVGRALHRLGIEHIPAYSPQARGRSEWLNRTLQDRLVNELRVAEIRSVDAANAYLQTTFMPHYHATFTRPPRETASAFVALGPVDLDQILCHEEERVVGKDKIGSFPGRGLVDGPFNRLHNLRYIPDTEHYNQSPVNHQSITSQSPVNHQSITSQSPVRYSPHSRDNSPRPYSLKTCA